MPSWKKVIVSGSDALLNTLTVTNGITGSLHGTASWAQNSITSSFVTGSNVFGPFGSNSVISASFATFAQTASHALNGGVTQILAGPNITISPLSGRGQVTISSTGTGSGNFNTSTGSYGSFYDTTTQINPVANAANSMSFNETAITNGVSLSGSTSPFNTYIKTETAGVYNIQFSAQIDKTDGGEDNIDIWIRKNGTDLIDTATSLTLPKNNNRLVAAWNWFVQSAANDYYQIIWSSADTDMRLLAEASSSTHPGIPSVILTANRIDQFLSNTGSFNGTFTGEFTGSLQGTASFANNATSASFATTASYVLNAVSASFATSASQSQNATTASYVLNAVSASFATTSSYVLNAVSSSFATTASYVSSNFQYEIHVSQIDGNDTTGDGSLLKPVASITKALTLTTAQRRVIVLHPGGYTENPTIPSGSITIQTTELTGGNTVLYGTLTIPTSGSGARISGFSMDNLAITGTAQAYVSNCTVNNNVVKSSSGYVEIINSEMQCISGIQISGAGTTIINGNKNVGIAVSNASAQVIIKGCNSVVTPSASAGNLAIVDCIVTALGGNGITITGASTTLTLLNSQVLVQAGNNVAPISVEGIYSIINTIYDKPNSTLTGTSTNSIDYFQYINADNITSTNGLTVTGSITVSGSVINTLTSSFAISASQATSASFATTSSYALNAVTASFVTASNVYGPFGSNSVISSSYALTASYALNGGSGGANPTVVHTQLTASTTWSFVHNLNTQTPLLQVYDLGYEQIIPNEIVSIDAFTSEIRFDYTQAGYAVASTGGGLAVTGSTPRLVQTVAATTWSFAHNLGTKYPGFEIFDSNDDVIIPAGIHAVDTDNAEIYFALPSTGVAIANFSGINGLSDNAVSASYAATASYSDAFNIGATQTRYATVTSSINGSNTIFTQATGSYTSAFFKYTVTSGSNARSGEIMSVWNGATAEFADNSTTDIGTTTDVTSSVAISGANVQLNMQTNTAGWRIKSIATYL
jgi:hypothetical protein